MPKHYYYLFLDLSINIHLVIFCIKLCCFSHFHCILSSASVHRNIFQLPSFFSSSVRWLPAIPYHIDTLYNSWACLSLFQTKCSCFFVLKSALVIDSLLFQWMSRFRWRIFNTHLKAIRIYSNLCTCLKLTSPIRSSNIGIIFYSWQNVYTIRKHWVSQLNITFNLSLVKSIFSIFTE